MNTFDLCSKPAVTAKATTPLIDLSKLMRQHHVGCVVVTERGTKPVGIVTDRDIVVEVLAQGLDPASVTAGDIMTPSPTLSNAGDDALWALKVMRDRGVRRLPVVDAAGDLAGVLAFDDLMQHIGTTLNDVAQLIGSERLAEGRRRN